MAEGLDKFQRGGRTGIRAARGVLGEGKGRPGSIQPGSARFASCTRRISSTYRGKLAVETRRRADCKYLLQGSIGTDPRRSKHFYKQFTAQGFPAMTLTRSTPSASIEANWAGLAGWLTRWCLVISYSAHA